MRQIEREELNMDPVDADFAKWEIGITALFLIFMIIYLIYQLFFSNIIFTY